MDHDDELIPDCILLGNPRSTREHRHISRTIHRGRVFDMVSYYLHRIDGTTETSDRLVSQSVRPSCSVWDLGEVFLLLQQSIRHCPFRLFHPSCTDILGNRSFDVVV